MRALRLDKQVVPTKFNGVAATYDRLTAANPGYHRHLTLSARRLGLPPRARILDLCCGTGASTAALRAVYPDAEIVGLDASAGMLERARGKPDLRATFVQGDATEPQAVVQGSFDGVLMAYGIRNLPDADRGLANLRHVLKPGAPVCFHEYSVADSTTSTALWNAVCWGVIIPFGLVTSPSSDIYRYLRRSVVAFDGVGAFEQRLRAAGFEGVHTLPMDGWQKGILHSFLARAPGPSTPPATAR